jgi:hypothetical protein
MSKISQIRSRLELQMVYDKIYTTRTKRPSLKSVILLSDESPKDLSALTVRRKRLKSFDLKIEALADELYLLRIQKVIWGRSVSGHVILDRGTRGCWIAYTDENGYFVKRVLEPFLNGLYPDVARVYFNYLEIQKFLQAIKDTYQGSSIVTYVAYKRQSRLGTDRPKGTRLLWERSAEEDLRKTIQDETRKHRIWIDSLTFRAENEAGMILLEASITGSGIARLRFGTFSDFHHNVIQLYIGLATKWRTFFSDRERRIEQGKVKLSPYFLQYPFDLEKPQIEELMTNLRGAYSQSVLFGGNPYFVANMTDYQEGSSFYMTILGGRITITPMLKSTAYALWRIAGRIQRVTGEGEILDITRKQAA